jgi:hypothetical protein
MERYISCIRKFNILRPSISPKFLKTFNTIPIKIPANIPEK